MDIDEYLDDIIHSVDSAGEIERTNKTGYRLDGSQGISVAIGFRENQLSKADYLIINADHIEIVELSDLGRQLDAAHKYFKELIDTYMLENDCSRVPAKFERKFRKEAFFPIKSELALKWMGSIATFERLIRLNPELTTTPIYKYCLVCKDANDLRAADHVSTMMQGMCENFKIINSSNY